VRPARLLSQAVKELAAMPSGTRGIVSICADGAKAVWRYWRIGKAEPSLNAVMKRRGTAFAVRSERR